MRLRPPPFAFCAPSISTGRAKGGTASVHPIGGRELRALRRLKREAPASVYVFVSERLAPLSVAGYQRMVARAGEAAGFPFLVHSHMLRHSCGRLLEGLRFDLRNYAARQSYLLGPWRSRKRLNYHLEGIVSKKLNASYRWIKEKPRREAGAQNV